MMGRTAQMNRARSQLGFTTMELLMALGASALVVLALVGVQKFFHGQQQDMTSRLEAQADAEIGRRVILEDIKAIDPSFNNLDMVDDDGLRFFDYYPDVPSASFGSSLSRRITMKPGGRIKSVVFLVQDDSAAAVPVMIYDPVAAYQVGTPPTDVNQPASLTFRSLNQNSYISGSPPNGAGRSGFWKNGQLLMLDTPALVRPTNGGKIDMMIRPRSPVFVGQVSGSNLGKSPILENLIDYKDPQDPYRVRSIDSADEFLRGAPSVGGGQPLIRLRAVKLIRYSIEPHGLKGGRVFKEVFENGRYVNKFALADKVKELVFERREVTSKTIFFTIDLEP